MLTAAQIRQARELLGWSRNELSRRTFLEVKVIDQAEDGSGDVLLSDWYAITIRTAVEAAGIVFVQQNGGGAGVRLRKVED